MGAKIIFTDKPPKQRPDPRAFPDDLLATEFLTYRPHRLGGFRPFQPQPYGPGEQSCVEPGITSVSPKPYRIVRGRDGK
jgi:hypothetical protein